MRNKKVDTLYAVFVVLVTFNGLGNLMVASAQSLETAIIFTKILYIGGIFSPVSMMLILARLCEIKIPKFYAYGLIALGLVTLGFVFTIGYSPLYYTEAELGSRYGASYLIKEYGPAHKIYPILMVTYMLNLVYYVINAIIHRKNKSAKVIILISISGFTVAFAYVFEKIIDIDHAGIAAGILVSTFFMRHLIEHINMFDMTSNIAVSVDKMKKYGYIELDNKFRFISANEYIKEIFPEVTEKWEIDKPVPETRSLLYDEVISWVKENGPEKKKMLSAGELYFEVSYADITCFGNKKAGRIIEFVDRTEEHTALLTIEKYNLKLQEEAERAAAADNAKTSFLAQMSHEIRTPINAVLGMNEMILRETNEENIREYASNAYSSGSALLSIINDILDISKIESGKLEITEAEYDLYSLISDSYLMLYGRAEKKGLKLEIKCDETLPSKLIGDMFHIRQIVINFLTNAVKYTDSGSITFKISGEEKDGVFLLKLGVKDTGIGLTEESKEKLFTSFQRFELERNKFVEGTGLGLSISKQLAELMGGSIDVESVYGEGSEFTCTIPQKITDSTPIGKIDPARTSAKENAEEKASFTAPSARILAVDDVEMNLVVFRSLLKERKLIIDTASSGKECLEMIQNQKYDIIFMDHMMPEMSGIETFETMKKTSHPNSGTPVVMLTANAISGEKEKYLAEGFASYLTKPLQSDKLEKTLLRFLPEEKVIYGKNKKNDVNNEKKDDNGGVSYGRFAELKEAVPDFSLDEALRNCSGSEDFYAEILKEFAVPEKLSELEDAFSKKDWKKYEMLIHTLKGSMRTFGFPALGNIAEALQKAAEENNEEFILKNHSKAAKKLAAVIDCAERL